MAENFFSVNGLLPVAVLDTQSLISPSVAETVEEDEETVEAYRRDYRWRIGWPTYVFDSLNFVDKGTTFLSRVLTKPDVVSVAIDTEFIDGKEDLVPFAAADSDFELAFDQLKKSVTSRCQCLEIGMVFSAPNSHTVSSCTFILQFQRDDEIFQDEHGFEQVTASKIAYFEQFGIVKSVFAPYLQSFLTEARQRHINFILYQGSTDLALMLNILAVPTPATTAEFVECVRTHIGIVSDVPHMINNAAYAPNASKCDGECKDELQGEKWCLHREMCYTGLEKLRKSLNVKRRGCMHMACSDARVSAWCYYALVRHHDCVTGKTGGIFGVGTDHFLLIRRQLTAAAST
jgi:hypothetical protein